MARNVVFVAPVIDEYAARYLRALAKLEDVRVLGVVHKDPPEESARLYTDLVRIPHPLDPEVIADGIATLRQRHGQPHRITGALEVIQEQLACARARFGVPGVTPKTASVFRDKNAMKDRLRAAGVPVARHRLVRNESEAAAFVHEIGLPLVVKPLDGVGARATQRVRTVDDLRRALREMQLSPKSPALLEELLVGDEYSCEAVTIAGKPQVFSFSKYMPGCLEVLENPWIQWACVLPREVNAPRFERAKDLCRRTIAALGLDYGMTHMEWFERPDGSLAVGEIAQRPPGPQLCQMTGLVHDVDIHRTWARCMVDEVLDAPWERKHAAGTVFVRGQGRGRVAGVSGLRELHAEIGEQLVEVKVPTLGAPKNESYEGDGYVVVRDETTEAVEDALAAVHRLLKVRYEA